MWNLDSIKDKKNFPIINLYLDQKPIHLCYIKGINLFNNFRELKWQTNQHT